LLQDHILKFSNVDWEHFCRIMFRNAMGSPVRILDTSMCSVQKNFCGTFLTFIGNIFAGSCSE